MIRQEKTRQRQFLAVHHDRTLETVEIEDVVHAVPEIAEILEQVRQGPVAMPGFDLGPVDNLGNFQGGDTRELP